MARARIVLNPDKTKCVIELIPEDGETNEDGLPFAFEDIYDAPRVGDDELIIADQDGSRYIVADYGTDGPMVYELTEMDTEVLQYDGDLSDYLEEQDEDDEDGEPVGASK